MHSMFAAPTAEETTTSRTLTPAQDTLVSAVEQKLAAWSAVRGKDWKRDVDASRHLTRALNKMVGGFLGEGFEARVVLYPVQQKDVADEAKAKHQDAEDKASAKGAQRP